MGRTRRAVHDRPEARQTISAPRLRIAALASLIAACIVPAGARAASIGISTDLQYLTGARLEHRLAAIRTLGADRVRLQLQWANVQPTRGRLRWALYDHLFRRIHAHGLQAVVVLQTTPGWARVGGCDGLLCRPADPRDYAAFAGAAARRYAGRVEAWEIWNEPNRSEFFKPGPDPDAYAALLKAAYGAIKAADAHAVVLTGGLAPAGTDRQGSGAYVSLSPPDFLQDLYDDGARGTFDAVGVHPYTFPALPLTSEPGSAWHQLADTHPSIRSIMEANGDAGLPLWATEFGAPTGPPGNPRAVSERLQAQMIRSGYAAWSAQDWAGPMFLWTYHDWRAPVENGRFGLVRADGSHKPAYRTVRGIAHTARTAGHFGPWDIRFGP